MVPGRLVVKSETRAQHLTMYRVSGHLIFFPFGSPVGCRPGVEPVLPPRTAILISWLCAKGSSVTACGAAQPRSILSVPGGLGCWDVQRLPVSPKRHLGFAEAPDDALSADLLRGSKDLALALGDGTEGFTGGDPGVTTAPAAGVRASAVHRHTPRHDCSDASGH